MAVEYLNGEGQWEVMTLEQVGVVAVLDSWADIYLAAKLVKPEGIPDPTPGDCDTLMIFPTTSVVTLPNEGSLDSQVEILYRDEINCDPNTRGKFRYYRYTPAELKLRELVNC